MLRKYRSLIRITVSVVGLTIIGFLKIPFIIENTTEPDDASTFVQVDGATKNKQGTFLVTSVGVSEATVFTSLLAILPDYTIEPEFDYIVPESYYEEEADSGEDTITASQINALVVAYRAAGKHAEVLYQGFYVGEVYPKSGLKQFLQKGDEIIRVNDLTFTNPYDLFEYVQQQKVGDTAKVEYKRGGVTMTAYAPLIIDEQTGDPHLGIQLYSSTRVSIAPLIEFQTNGVEGSSGGLMFSLEIYNQLMENDITKGHIIAGTGTIDQKGNVGRIAGVEKKVVSADKAGATIFFVPEDTISPEVAALNPKLRSNYREAVRAAIEIDSDMKIVPVKTFDDAIFYLQNLQQ